MNIRYLLIILLTSSALASNVEPMRDKACPDGWSLTDTVVPVIASTSNPWGVGTDDKSIAKAHLSAADSIETIDAVPITDDDRVNDLLTVASECLAYRNMLVDNVQYNPPSPPVRRNTATGFIAASVF